MVKTKKGSANEASSRSLWQDAWRRFKKNRLAMICLVFVAMLTLVSIGTLAIDIITDKQFYDENVINQQLARKLEAPSLEHPFGMDEFGRDVLMRILWGTRYSLFMGTFSVMASLIVGGFFGALAGFYGGRVDNVIMRVMDVLMAMPSILLAIAIVAALGPGLVNVVIAIGISYVPSFARVVRASVMTVRGQEFVEAASAVGASNARIIFRQIIPNAMAPIIVQATLGAAGAILSIAGLSFLGLGIQPPVPEWGAILSNARTYIRDAWHITVIPGCMILLTILALNIVGDGLRDALDPKLKT